MAFVPGRRNRPVADAAIAETPVATGQTNDNPYSFDDADVEADYATAEEFRSYDDPDSVEDILRDKPEQFYVGTEQKSGKIQIIAQTYPLAILYEGVTITTGPCWFYGLSFMSLPSQPSTVAISAINSSNPNDTGPVANLFVTNVGNLNLGYGVYCPNGLSIKQTWGAKNTTVDNAVATIHIGREI